MRGERQSGRDQLFLPRGDIFGVWISVNSTNVNRIRCDQDTDQYGNRLPTGKITIEFLSLAMYEYPGRPLNDFLDLFTSSSKGRFTYYEVRGDGPSYKGMGNWKPFRKIADASRTKEQVAKLKKSREPRTALQAARYYNVGGKARARGGIPSR